MLNSLDINKNYKCSVENCSNLVHYKGSFCSSCIEKIYHNEFYVEICGFCKSVYKIFTGDRPNYVKEELIVYIACEKCRKQIMDQIQDANNKKNSNDNDSKDDDDNDEIDDWLNELDKLF